MQTRPTPFLPPAPSQNERKPKNPLTQARRYKGGFETSLHDRVAVTFPLKQRSPPLTDGPRQSTYCKRSPVYLSSDSPCISPPPLHPRPPPFAPFFDVPAGRSFSLPVSCVHVIPEARDRSGAVRRDQQLPWPAAPGRTSPPPRARATPPISPCLFFVRVANLAPEITSRSLLNGNVYTGAPCAGTLSEAIYIGNGRERARDRRSSRASLLTKIPCAPGTIPVFVLNVHTERLPARRPLFLHLLRVLAIRSRITVSTYRDHFGTPGFNAGRRYSAAMVGPLAQFGFCSFFFFFFN